MNVRTRHLLLNIATAIAVTTAAAVVFLPAAASAAPTTVSSNVNLRSSPGGNVIGTVHAGETVDVQQCQSSWCYISRPGTDGWVSAQYLKGVNIGTGLQFGFSIGPGGKPNVQIGVGTGPAVEDESSNDEGEVCFYSRTNFRGSSFCVDAGDTMRDLGGRSVSSIENPDGYDVTVCDRTRLRGNCRTYTSDSRSLGDLNGDILSVEVE